MCDSLGACSTGDSTMVTVAPGEARTIEALLEDTRAHVRRCELMALRRLAASAVVTYTVSKLAFFISTMAGTGFKNSNISVN